MQPGQNRFPLLRFTTHGIPERERLQYWRRVCRVVDIEPLGDRPFEAEGAVLDLPGLHIGWCHSKTPACWKRTAELVKHRDDAVALLLPVGGRMTCSHLGREIEVEAGEGVGVLHAVPVSICFRSLKHIAIWAPRSALSPLVRDLDAAVARLIPRRTEALRLLRSYATTLRDMSEVGDPVFAMRAAGHIHDLMALALGATPEAAEMAEKRSGRAAKLAAIKRDIANDPGCRLGTLATRYRVTPRSIQKLFADAGTTFSAYVMEQRLANSRSMLLDPAYADWTIGAIAMEAGFGDLSHFNRKFKRRYGATPSDLRATLGAETQQALGATLEPSPAMR